MKKITLLILSVLTFCFAALTGCAGYVPPEYEAIPPGEIPDKVAGEDYTPLQRFDETVTLTAAGISFPLEDGYPADTTTTNNGFYKAAKAALNIEIRNVFNTAPDNYDTMLNLAIASNSMPDIVFTSIPAVYKQLREADALADIGSDFWHLNPVLQKMYTTDFPNVLPTVMERGQIFAFPQVANQYEEATRLYIRKDWLEIVGKTAPTTIDEMIEVGEAFVKNKDKLAGNATIPFAAHKNIFDMANFGLLPVFHAFSSAPTAYLKSGENLIDGTVKEGTDRALQALNEMYAKKILDNRFTSRTADDVIYDVQTGKVGMVFGTWWTPEWPLGLSVEEVKDCDWVAVNIPSGIPGQTTKPVVSRVLSSGYIMIKKGANVKAAIELINLFYDMYYNDNAAEIYGANATKEGGFFHNYVPIKLWDASASIAEFKRANVAFSENLKKIENGETVGMTKEFWPTLKTREIDLHVAKGWPYLQANPDGGVKNSPNTGWGIYHCMISDDSGYAYVAQLTETKDALFNEFYGASLPQMIAYGVSITTYAQTEFSKMINGDRALSTWNTFVNEYNNRGGQVIIDELNTKWYPTVPHY